MNSKKIWELAGKAMDDHLSNDQFIEAVKENPSQFYAFTQSELETFVNLIIEEAKNEICSD